MSIDSSISPPAQKRLDGSFASALASRVRQQLRDLPDLPKPGAGQTRERWRALSLLGAEDLSVAKVLEAHYDACAILAEAGEPAPEPDTVWAVWAAGGPQSTLRYAPRTAVVSGSKPWCSGGDGMVTHALVTAAMGQHHPLVAVPLTPAAFQMDASAWHGPGMRAVHTGTGCFTEAPAWLVGDPSFYLERPGFWHGGAGIAACWYGAATAVAEPLRQAAAVARNPFCAAHLGAIDVLLGAAAAMLTEVAAQIDEAPTLAHRQTITRLRLFIDRTCREVLERTALALGPGPLCTDAEHGQRCADLAVFIRQSHAERDEQWLGEQLHAEDASPWHL